MQTRWIPPKKHAYYIMMHFHQQSFDVIYSMPSFLYLIVVFWPELALDVGRLYLKEEMKQ